MKTKQPNMYSQMQRFATVTQTLIMQGNIQRAKHCLQIAENIYNGSTAEIKNAIANTYVFSVSTFLEIHHCSIKNLLPKSLQNEYYKQVNTSGI